ncbi:MAG TPA: hemolysin family protein [Thermoanaerobaculia bacterium]|nr:hemolysin family protein [Thermoanaerobaculia bacterium]
MPEPRIAPGILAWGVALVLPLAVLVSTLSALLERSGPIRLRHWAEEAGGRLRALYDSPVRFGVFRYLLSFLARVLPLALYVLLADLLVALERAHPHAWTILGLIVLLAVAEAGNRSLVGHDPERALRRLTRVYRIALLVLAPLVAGLSALVPAGAIGRRDERSEGVEGEASDEEIEAFIDVGTREGILEPETGEMLWSLVDFVDTQARSVMTPRIDIVCAAEDSSLESLALRFVDSGHSRLPIFEGSIDKIVGILHIRDLLRALLASERPLLPGLLKPPLFIPETKPLGELLKELQTRFQQVAIVVDEYGGTAGLVTVEDIVEEIVGEIVDEHDALVAELEPLPGGGYRLDGRARIELLDELFEVDVEDAEYETVAGLIFTELGHVPEVGETVEREGLRFTVEAAADRRIEKVRVERIVEPEAAAGGEN